MICNRSSNIFFIYSRVNIIGNWHAWKMRRPAGIYLKPGNFAALSNTFCSLLLGANILLAEISI